MVDQIQYNKPFRWFVGLAINDRMWRHWNFSKNRERLLGNAVLSELFTAVLAKARTRRPLSEDHFSVDCTVMDAWASHKNFCPRDDDDDTPTGPERDYRGESRTNDLHVSTIDPDAELMRKGEGMEARQLHGVHHVVC